MLYQVVHEIEVRCSETQLYRLNYCKIVLYFMKNPRILKILSFTNASTAFSNADKYLQTQG